MIYFASILVLLAKIDIFLLHLSNAVKSCVSVFNTQRAETNIKVGL